MKRALLSLLVFFGVVASASAQTSLFTRVGNLPTPRAGAAASVHRGGVFIVGGQQSGTSRANNAISSRDGGASWTGDVPDDRYVRTGAQMITFQRASNTVPSLVIAGGKEADATATHVSGLLDAIPSFSWDDYASGSSAPPARSEHGFLAVQSAANSNKQMVVFGGLSSSSTLLNDVWMSSANGDVWTQVVVTASDNVFTPRRAFGYSTIASQSRVVIVGGYCGAGTVLCTDVWISNVGLTAWKQVNNDNIPSALSTRAQFPLITINSILYAIGGRGSAGVLSDIWLSPDGGRTWMLVSSSTGFSARHSMAAVAIDGTLLVIGGRDDASFFSDVWQMSV